MSSVMGPAQSGAAVARILIVEDDVTTGDMLQEALRRHGHEVRLCRDGEEGLSLALQARFDLLILDVVLPGRSGLEILVSLRKLDTRMLVLMLSTRDEVDDRVLALSLSADDYLGKPFALKELLARVEAMLRRMQLAPQLTLKVADLHLDVATRQVTRAGHPIKLTLREFEILKCLMHNAGRVVSRTMLAQEVWKHVTRVTTFDDIIDVHMSHLRRKINRAGHDELLHTVRGVGFCLSQHRHNAEAEAS
jgi:two-component system, OmpR family, copper resistance phosphate regulon response regulator CusR